MKDMFELKGREIERQMGSGYDFDQDLRISSNRGETLDPVIRGAKKINEDPEIRNIVKKALIR